MLKNRSHRRRGRKRVASRRYISERAALLSNCGWAFSRRETADQCLIPRRWRYAAPTSKSSRRSPTPWVDNRRSAAIYSFYGESDLPTRRHAEESRPALSEEDASMSSINTISPEKLIRLIGT